MKILKRKNRVSPDTHYEAFSWGRGVQSGEIQRLHVGGQWAPVSSWYIKFDGVLLLNLECELSILCAKQ